MEPSEIGKPQRVTVSGVGRCCVNECDFESAEKFVYQKWRLWPLHFMGKHTESNTITWSALLVGLYGTHYRKLVACAQRIVHDRALAEECVQDAFMTYHLKGSSPAPGSELAYLRSMVRNGAISLLRRERRYLEVALAGEVPIQRSAESCAVAAVMVGHITARLGNLAPRQGEVVRHRLLGLSVAETATAMSVSSGTVKTHRHRAAETMRLALGEFAAA